MINIINAWINFAIYLAIIASAIMGFFVAFSYLEEFYKKVEQNIKNGANISSLSYFSFLFLNFFNSIRKTSFELIGSLSSSVGNFFLGLIILLGIVFIFGGVIGVIVFGWKQIL